MPPSPNLPTSTHRSLYPAVPSCPSLTNFSSLGQWLPCLADDCNLLGKLQMENPGTLHRLKDSESPGMGPGNLHFEHPPANCKFFGQLSFGDSGHPGELLRYPIPFSHQRILWNNLASLLRLHLLPRYSAALSWSPTTLDCRKCLHLPGFFTCLQAPQGQEWDFSHLHLQHAAKGHAS